MPNEEDHRVVLLLQNTYVFWLDDGWGINALVERQTHQHRGLDIYNKDDKCRHGVRELSHNIPLNHSKGVLGRPAQLSAQGQK